jgi:hypothetical protein
MDVNYMIDWSDIAATSAGGGSGESGPEAAVFQRDPQPVEELLDPDPQHDRQRRGAIPRLAPTS